MLVSEERRPVTQRRQDLYAIDPEARSDDKAGNVLALADICGTTISKNVRYSCKYRLGPKLTQVEHPHIHIPTNLPKYLPRVVVVDEFHAV